MKVWKTGEMVLAGEGRGSRNQNGRDKGLTRSWDQGLEGNDPIRKFAKETGKERKICT